MYEPKFDRDGTTRRVLGHITDNDHLGRGPRNTAARLMQELAEDPHTIYAGDRTEMHDMIAALISAGLVAARDDGTLYVTGEGAYELGH